MSSNDERCRSERRNPHAIFTLLCFLLLPAWASAAPQKQLPCYFQTDHVYEGVSFRIHRVDDCVPGNSKLALIVFLHGDGFEHTEYGAFMKALAALPAIVVSVHANGSNAQRSEKALAAIDYVHNKWSSKHRVGERVAFIGHSRGGEAVLTAAREFSSIVQGPVDAVVSIMATDNQEGGGLPESLVSHTSKSYLALAASRDEDVLGYCSPVVAGCSNSMRGSLTLYDRAGTEWGNYDVGDYLIDKSAKRLPGLTHGGWINNATQRAVVHDYVIRFLRWQMFDVPSERAYFTTAKESAFIEGVVSQYSQHATPSFPIDTFQNGVLKNSDGGTNLVTTTGAAIFQELPVRDSDPTAAHDSKALAIRWTGGLSSMRWTFPKENQFDILPTIDVRSFPYMSLRATRIFDSPLDTSQLNVRLRFTDKSNKSADVVLGSGTPYAIPRASVELGVFTAYHKVTNTITNSMGTLRIPLRAFDGIDKSAIRSVSLIVGQDSRKGAVLIDSMELTY